MQTAYFNRFYLNLPDECVEDCSRPGLPADENVDFWFKQGITAEVEDEPIRAELKETGGWNDEELSDDEQNRKRIIWIAACNIRDEMRLP